MRILVPFLSCAGLCIASVGKPGVRHSAFLAALLGILSIVLSYESMKIPKLDGRRGTWILVVDL